MQLRLAGSSEGFGIVEVEGDGPQTGELDTLEHGIMTYEQIRALQGDEAYYMSLVGNDAEWAAKVLKHGIDSCLEACYVRARGDSYSWHGMHRLECYVSPLSLPVLLRRLLELDEEGECPGLLVDSIIETLERQNEE